MREISIPGLAALLAFPLAACASVHEDYEGVGYSIYTDFRVESSVTDSEGLPEGAVGWFGSSPVYEEKSQHPGYLAFILKDGESRGILLKNTIAFKCRTPGAACVPDGINAEKNGRKYVAEAEDFSDFQRIFRILKGSSEVKQVMPQVDAGVELRKM